MFGLFAVCFIAVALATGAEVRDVWSALKIAYKTVPIGSGLASELRAQVDFLPVTACEVRPEARKPVTHVYGP